MLESSNIHIDETFFYDITPFSSIPNNLNREFLEPSLTFKSGYKNFNIVVQYVLDFVLENNTLSNRTHNLYCGIEISFNARDIIWNKK